MKCPGCNQAELVRTAYEGIGVNICPACHGFLLSDFALKGIERKIRLQENIEKAPDRMSYVDYDNRQIDSLSGYINTSGLVGFIINSLFLVFFFIFIRDLLIF